MITRLGRAAVAMHRRRRRFAEPIDWPAFFQKYLERTIYTAISPHEALADAKRAATALIQERTKRLRSTRRAEAAERLADEAYRELKALIERLQHRGRQ